MPVRTPTISTVPAWRNNTRPAAIVALCVLVGAGIACRWLDSALAVADATPIQLAQPLSTLPLKIAGWQGTDIPLDKHVIEIAGCDDYVNRRYVRKDTGQVVGLYVAYAARPAKMLSHRPQVCYPSAGWTHASTRTDRIRLEDGRELECLFHHFQRTQPTSEEIVVLSYYIIEGRYATDWTDFWGPKWRLPNLSRDPSFYVAQVQVSAAAPPGGQSEQIEGTIKGVARQAASSIEGLLPRKSGENISG